MKYTQIPATAFQNIQLNAGILADSFVPATGTIGRLLGATTGGVNFTDTPEFSDFGEDIDNCPKNTKELKKLVSHEAKMSGTFVTIDAATAHLLAAAADVDSQDASHIVPRNDLELTDFKDIWWIGDYSDVNTGDNAGFVAIHLMNALNTGGFQIQSTDKAKGQFAFEFTGHYSMDAQDTVPYEIYIQQGASIADVTVAPEASDTTFPWTEYTPSQFQTGISVVGKTIKGTLKFIEGGLASSGPLAGDGNFLALKFSANWDAYTSVKVGLVPSASGMDLVEILTDPDKNGVFKIANTSQVFKVVATDGVSENTDIYSLADLVLETE